MQLQEAQGIVRMVCQILLMVGGGILVFLGVLRLLRPRGHKQYRDAVILGFLAEHPGRDALSCPLVNLGENGQLRPVAVQTLKMRWKQKPGDTIRVCFSAGNYSHVTLADESGQRGFAAAQILCGLAVVIVFGLRLLGKV